MGIVNVTPDSFSDGGHYFDEREAVAHALGLVGNGAHIIDIGGESTRPGAASVSLQEELDRVMPVVEDVCRQTDTPVSIDTSKAAVAEAAVRAGAEIINDVTGLEADADMVDVAVRLQAGVCVMHMLGTPQTMQQNPSYDDVVDEIYTYLQDRKSTLRTARIGADRICLDPGIGFGKKTEHNLRLIRECARFHKLGCPLVVGHSRKGFIGRVLDDDACDRTPGTIGVAISLAQKGVQILRVHDVAAVRQALVLYDATGGENDE